MTYHFVNLVSWKFFSEKVSDRQIIYVDSLSLQFMCLLFGRKIKRISGVSYFNNSLESIEAFYLTTSVYKSNAHFVLPFWRKIEEIVLTNDLILAIKQDSNLVIGISSPKQDKLAELIISRFPDKTVYCLGAEFTLIKKRIGSIDTAFLGFSLCFKIGGDLFQKLI